jgi:hypothetical protein
MALAATIVFEVRTTGSDTNGGGYKSNAGTTDYSQQDAAQLSVADAACAGNTTVTSATGGFTAAMVGSIMYLSSGPGWYEITARASSNSITIDRNGPNASGMTANVGGALASPGGLGALLVAVGGITAGQKAYVKSGTYNLTGTTVNVSGGPLDLGVTNLTNKNFYLKGYQTDRADLTGTRPVIAANGNAPTQMLKVGGNTAGAQTAENFDINGGSQATNGITGVNATTTFVNHCYVYDCDGTTAFTVCTATACKAFSCAATGFATSQCYFCWSDACEIGFSSSYATFCVASNGSSDGFLGQLVFFAHCISYNNVDGFERNSANRPTPCVNCISFSDSGYGYKGLDLNGWLISCAYGGDGGGSGRSDTTPLSDLSPITLTSDPFTNAAGGDFSLNNTAGGGALLRAAGFDPFWGSGFADIGVFQHQDSGGSTQGYVIGG